MEETKVIDEKEIPQSNNNDNKSPIIKSITKKGMAIRFPVENVNPMGKVACGVTGISLRNDDEVIFGKFTSDYVESGGNILALTSKGKEKEKVKIKDVKLQNRAGRGTNVMMVVLGDEIISVSVEG